ncbi:hypothetical protein [Spiroplasma endosymbiont of Polydrusus formosus]|uniref:hypothetical protein n=1 Tax=Spiroplasma endosymbiont of Polydrusus formosus TaxID=3139326 RepID=UPI0035B5311D
MLNKLYYLLFYHPLIKTVHITLLTNKLVKPKLVSFASKIAPTLSLPYSLNISNGKCYLPFEFSYQKASL